jgi:hypothetical protein
MSNPFQSTTQVNAVIRTRRGPESDRTQLVYDSGELIYSTDRERLYIGDGEKSLGTMGGVLVGNKVWIAGGFDNLPYIEKYDLVYRTDTTGFYVLTGDVVLDPDSYHLIGGELLATQNSSPMLVGNTTIPIATNNDLGAVIIRDGLTIDPTGLLSIDYDPTSIGISNNKIYAKSTASVPHATYNIHGSVKIDQNKGITSTDGVIGLSLDNNTIKLSATGGDNIIYVDSSSISLPKASTTVLGAIKIGDGLSANSVTGVANVVKASTTQLGGIKVGSGLSANPVDGQLDVLPMPTLLSSNGYSKLPNGLLMQWGSAGGASSNPSTVAFPLSFPNSCFSVVITNNVGPSNVAPTQDAIATFNITLTGFKFRTNAGNTGGYNGNAGGPMWQAIGY